MRLRNLLISLMILILLNAQLFAQGICVPDKLKLNSIKGKVLAHLDKGDEPLQDIIIRITKKNRPKKIIKETKTDKNGSFNVGNLKDGNYSLIASYQGLENFYLDLSLYSKNVSKSLTIWLGADFLKPCSGSYAELK